MKHIRKAIVALLIALMALQGVGVAAASRYTAYTNQKTYVYKKASKSSAKKSVKVNFELNTGWKVKSLTGMKFGETNKAFTWKKNRAVTFGNAGTVVFSILLKNKKNNDEFEYLVMVSR